MYQAYGLLKPDSDFTIAAAAQKLGTRFPGFDLQQAGDTLTLATRDWEIHLRLNADPQVVEDSREIAEGIAGWEDGTDIAACTRRVEVASDIPDPEMEHFN